MTNDAKLGLLVGVLGVVAAAVFVVKQPTGEPTPPAPSLKGKGEFRSLTLAGEEGDSLPSRAERSSAPSPIPFGGGKGGASPAFGSTPVVRTRKDAPAQPVARPVTADEEP
ncbi:MAG: hypothetical protein K2V38_06480 [Gemmataceae bacterium]|nr:hypothetical protein [Gemmataceae bacterium]